MSSARRSILQERPEDTISSDAGVVLGIVRSSLVMNVSQEKARKHELMQGKHEEERLKSFRYWCFRV